MVFNLFHTATYYEATTHLKLETAVYIKYLLVTPPKMVHNTSGGHDSQVEKRWSEICHYTEKDCTAGS